MRIQSITILFFVLIFSCKPKTDTPQGLGNELKKTMQDYLYNAINNDSSNVKYRVEKVVYYDDNLKDRYICEFTVHLKAKLFDTTGIMKANISKDLKKVERLQ